MLLQTNKKGVSLMIGYVLLITIAVVMGGVMYAWMKSYVPTEELACPEGVSIIVTSHYYNNTDPNNATINITIKNNGRFSFAGYYIKATNDPTQTLATIDLASRLIQTDSNLFKYANAVILGGGNQNTFTPGNATYNLFNVSGMGKIETIELIPVRWQKDSNNKLRFLGCKDITKFKENIIEST